jgi:hypothetical protein
MSSEPGPYFELIGKRVLAVMDRQDTTAWIIGTLVDSNWYGEFVIETDQGRRYCWPLVHCELMPAAVLEAPRA